MAETCATCRWWNAHSAGSRLGDCMIDHRFWRVPSQVSGTGAGRHWIGSAMLDSFGREETKATDACGAFDRGDGHPPYEHQPKKEAE